VGQERSDSGYATGERTGSTRGSGQDWTLPRGGLQDKRTVRIMTAGDTARRGDNYTGS
jgi:hypothetical protein